MFSNHILDIIYSYTFIDKSIENFKNLKKQKILNQIKNFKKIIKN